MSAPNCQLIRKAHVQPFLIHSFIVVGLLAVALPAQAVDTDISTDGWKLTVVATQQAVTIDPLTLKSGSFDAKLEVGTPSWRGPTLLPGPAWAYNSLRADTLTARLTDDPKRVLVVGKDFLLDPLWASVATTKDGGLPAGTVVHFEFQYGLSRIDLIEKSPSGSLVVIKGVEDKSQPLLPNITAGNTPLFSVYLPNSATALKPEMINRIDPNYDGVPPVINGEPLKPIKEKLAAGKPVTIVFFGDSITAQENKDMRDQKGSFVDRLAAYLKEIHPDRSVPVIPRGQPVPEPKDKQIVVAKAGVGGDDTVRALKRIDADVLAHRPDLVVIMFGVNDENRRGDGNSVPVPVYKKNIELMVTKVRAAGGEPLLMTTSMKNRGWVGTVGNLSEYAQAMREVAVAQKACLVDNFTAWEDLPKRGYNYMVFLGNCINHPVDLGHDLFFRGLRSALK